MKALKGAVMFLLLLSLAALPASAHCMEVGFKVMDNNGDTVDMDVTVMERDGGRIVKLGRTKSGPSGYNFFIDFNTDSCTGVNIANLDEGTEYVIVFDYSEPTALCFSRNSCTTSYDTYYTVTSGSVVRVEGSCNEEWEDYPDCRIYPPTSDLSVSLRIDDVNFIGDKIIFDLLATASGGNGSYLFDWDGASRLSPTAYTNPNLARRTILRSQTTEVSVTVTSGTDSVEKEITLSNNRIP